MNVYERHDILSLTTPSGGKQNPPRWWATSGLIPRLKPSIAGRVSPTSTLLFYSAMTEGNELNRDIDWAVRQKAPSSCKHVLMVLANRADKNHRCFPSLASIAEDTGMARRSVIRCLILLEELQLISKVHRGINSTVYTLNVVTQSHHSAKHSQVSNVVTESHHDQGHTVTTDKCSVVTQCHPGSDAVSPPVVTQCHMEPPIEPKENPKGDIPPKKKARRKTDPPEHIEITDHHKAWAKSEKITSNLFLETQKMLDHFRGKGEQKVDWLATWRNWMRNSMVYNRNGGNGNGSRGNKQDQNAEGAREVWAALHPEDSFGDERGATSIIPNDLFGEPIKS